MDAFVWDQRLVTDLPTVDNQHRHLVDIVNLVGDMLLSTKKTAPEHLQQVFKQLADYACNHFADEERLMKEVNVDMRHQTSHIHHHQQFVEQVVSMWNARSMMSNPAEALHGFLSAWLTFHILGEDQAMARQIHSIRSGLSPTEAYDRDAAPEDSNTSILLGALNKLYHLLSVQNQDLANTNRVLEQKVEERTQALTQANARLAKEQQELTSLLKKYREAQSQLLQSEKMATIGQLAAGVAHEINNPVGFVSSNLVTLGNYTKQLLELIGAYEAAEAGQMDPARIQALKKEMDLGYLREDLPALLAESQDGLQRVKKIVQNLKDFSHVDEAEWQDADLNAGLENTLNVVWNEIKYKAEVVKEYGSLPPVRCLAAQVNQVFMNLLVNAAQAISDHGTITLRTGVEGEQAWVEVSDTGCGMTPEVMHRVFEPFFTTKPVGKGTGLGLSLAWDIIVNKHGGTLKVKSQPGQGSTFRLSLPIMGKPAKAAT